jgi:hypothetical protein
VTLAPKGLLIEEQRTNLLLQSEAFDSASWTKNNVTITANNATAPSGDTTADLWTVLGGSLVTPQCFQAATTTAAVTTFSVYIKTGNHRYFQVRFGAGSVAGGSGYANFDVGGSGAIGDIGGGLSSASITAVGNGWFRCVITGTTLAASGNQGVFVVSGPNAPSAQSWTPSEAVTGYVWGAQIEAGAFPTSYIPTTTATATRAPDVAVMTGANFSNWYNQTEGTLFIDAQPGPIASGTFPRLLHAANEDNSNRIQMLRYNINTPRVGVVISNVTQAAFDTPNTWASGVVGKMAFAVKQADFAAVFAAGTVATATSGNMPTLTRLNIGSEHVSGGGAVSFINGHIRRLAFFPPRLSKAELQGITA